MNPTTASDPVEFERRGEWLKRARSGDREAMRLLVEDLSPHMWRTARYQGLSREAASDVVQTGWMKLIKNWDLIDEPKAITGWLTTTIRRDAARVHNTVQKEASIRPTDVPDEPEVLYGDLDENLIRSQEHRAVRRAMARIKKPCRELLAYISGVSKPDYDSIAHSLGMKKGSVGPTRSRCLEKLRLHLQEDPEWTQHEGD